MNGNTIAMDVSKGIEVLNGPNFSTWSSRLMFLLGKDDLWGYVDGTKRLRENPSAKEIEKFDSESNKARSIIGLHVANDLIHIVADSPSPQEAFERLRNMFEPKTASRKAQVYVNFILCKCQEDSPLEYLNKMKIIFNDVKALKLTFDEDFFLIMVLMNLPNRLESLSQNMMGTLGTLTFESMYSRLQMEEMRVKGREMLKNSQTGIAFGVSTKNQNKNKGKGKGQKGGKKSNSSQEDSDQQKKSSDKKCFFCKKTGHFIKECRLKAKKDSQGDDKLNQDKSFSKIEGKNDDIAFSIRDDELPRHPISTPSQNELASACKGRVTNDWLIDSGASNHCCNDEEAFEIYEEIEPRHMVQFDGSSVQAIGIGEIVLTTQVPKGETRIRIKNVLHVQDCSNNVISVGKCAEKGAVYIIKGNLCEMRFQDELILVGEKKNSVYYGKWMD